MTTLTWAILASLLSWPSPRPARQAVPVLQVVFPGGQAELRPVDLASLPRDSVRTRIHDGPERWYSGPSLIAVLRRAGARVDTVRGPALGQYVLAGARDGYRVLFSLAELAPSLGNQRVILVDRIDGLALPPEEGPWRLCRARRNSSDALGSSDREDSGRRSDAVTRTLPDPPEGAAETP